MTSDPCPIPILRSRAEAATEGEGPAAADVAEPTATSLEAAQNYLAAVDQGLIEGDPAQVAKHRAFVLPHSKLDDHSKTTVANVLQYMRAARENNEFKKLTNLTLYYRGRVANKEQRQAINDLSRELKPDWNDPAYKSYRLREGEKQSALQDTQKAVLQEREEAHKAQEPARLLDRLTLQAEADGDDAPKETDAATETAGPEDSRQPHIAEAATEPASTDPLDAPEPAAPAAPTAATQGLVEKLSTDSTRAYGEAVALDRMLNFETSSHGWQAQEKFVNRLIAEANQSDYSQVPAELRPQLDAYLDKLQTSQSQIANIAGEIRGHRRDQAKLDRKYAPRIAENKFVDQITDPDEKAKAREMIADQGLQDGAQAYIDDVHVRNAAAASAPTPSADTKATDDFLDQFEDPDDRERAKSLIDEHGLKAGAERYSDQLKVQYAADLAAASEASEVNQAHRQQALTKATTSFLDQIKDPNARQRALSLIDQHGLQAGAQKYIDNPTTPATTSDPKDTTPEFSGENSPAVDEKRTESIPYTPTPDPTPASDTAFHDDLADDLAADMGYGDQYATTERVVQDFDTGPEFSTENSPATGAGTLVVPPRGDERGEGASGIVAVTDEATPASPDRRADFHAAMADYDRQVTKETIAAAIDEDKAAVANEAADLTRQRNLGIIANTVDADKAADVAETEDPKAQLYNEAIRHTQNPDNWESDERSRRMARREVRSSCWPMQKKRGPEGGYYIPINTERHKCTRQTRLRQRAVGRNLGRHRRLTGARRCP